MNVIILFVFSNALYVVLSEFLKTPENHGHNKFFRRTNHHLLKSKPDKGFIG